MLITPLASSLFANFCILATFVFIAGMLSKRYVPAGHAFSLLGSVNAGLLFGIFGIVLMSYSFPVGHHTYANLRHLTIVLAATYAGWLPSLICSVLLAVSRVLFYQLNYESVSAAVSLLVSGLGCCLISRLPWDRLRKMTVSNLLNLIIILATLVNNLGGWNAAMTIYPVQLIAVLGAGLVIYYIAEYIQRSNELYSQLQISATTDYLTGLHNLQQFHRYLELELDRSERRSEPLSLLVLDIDHFKAINDTYGHPAGDAVLKQLAHRLRSHSRSYDYVSRNGGEEFAVLLPDCSLAMARRAGERIRSAVADERFTLPSGQKIPVTISIGAASYPQVVEEASGELLFQYADQALYEAKVSGRNRVAAAQAAHTER
ncbi:GGDEF domain-containing protein [Paenibacillus glufosinatiresistens]|uniref:GGDEF domain-containing protein n=1 Tax=Paenibacillus glufosinatiresistens TaxID=3070657 RepID=UPI00286E6DFF|nr:diguanylate cyclase [Paenibacillus sp. YX.27]